MSDMVGEQDPLPEDRFFITLLTTREEGSYNYSLWASEQVRTDSAQACYWYDEGDNVLTEPNSRNQVRGTEQVIDVTGHGAGAPDTSSCALFGSIAYRQSRRGALASDGRGENPQGSATDAETLLPRVLALYPPAPNPAGVSALIRLDVPASAVVSVDVAVYDVTGRRVRQVVQGTQPPGRYAFVWDLSDSQGRSVAPGVYFVRGIAGEYRRVYKLVVLR
jgi:FlgD Ig-like domain